MEKISKSRFEFIRIHNIIIITNTGKWLSAEDKDTMKLLEGTHETLH